MITCKDTPLPLQSLAMSEPLSTQPYKGVRDFYPEDMAIQRYMFDTWSRTAESFGYQRYDASILEPAALYKAKGAENEEMVNEQTYTFTDRGGREVTLRPEMTPTVARMVAGRQHQLTPPTRWYSIPNLFRYERTQRGRLREHYQLNCDLFGVDDIAADIEIIMLAHQLLTDFGATSEMFEIKINDRRTMNKAYELLGITNPDTVTAITRLNDRKNKIDGDEYLTNLTNIVEDQALAHEIKAMIETSDPGENAVVKALVDLGLTNVQLDRSLARGFDYYTRIVFEIFDKHPDGNKRSLLGGGRYENLTGLFSNTPTSGIGFGLGDVGMRDFLETHNLLPDSALTTVPLLTIIPISPEENQPAQVLAQQMRTQAITTSIDFSARKRDKKFKTAKDSGVRYLIIIGPDEVNNSTYTLQDLQNDHQIVGTIDELISAINTSKA